MIPRDIRLMVYMALLPIGAMAQAPAPARLAGTAWNAVEVVGTAVPASMAADRLPHLVFGEDGRLSGADGCNRLTGPYTLDGARIAFGVLAGTMMACPETDELANRFRSALKGTGHWQILDGRLHFYGATGKPLAIFAPAPPAKK